MLRCVTARARRDGGWWLITLDDIGNAVTEALRREEIEGVAYAFAAEVLAIPASEIQISLEIDQEPRGQHGPTADYG